jgi:hypothetical protein
MSTFDSICAKCVSGTCDPMDNHLCDQQGPTWCVGTSLSDCKVSQTRLDGTAYQSQVAAMQFRQSGRLTDDAGGLTRNCADQVVGRSVDTERAEAVRSATSVLSL